MRLMMKNLLFFCLLFPLLSYSQSPTYKFTGQVTDADGEPLIGASILIKDSSHGTVTDLDGIFELSVPDSCATLVFHYTGFTTLKQETCVGIPLQVVLSLGMVLDEVVVVGYGSHSLFKKRKVRKAIARGQHRARVEKPTGGESYAKINENSFIQASQESVSTFGIDVDAASYSNVRRFINLKGQLPPQDAVRSEEMINYFRYQYPAPAPKAAPFSVVTELAACPWNAGHQLLLVGMRGQSMAPEDMPPNNLVFLLDVSGSMSDYDKLPLLKESLKLLVCNLREEDFVSIVVYAGAAGLVLPPTSGADQHKILAALDQLNSGGSTAGAAGIQLAYETARANFKETGNNRVILATDGDFNVGVSSTEALEDLIVKERESGISLSVLGFGQGNLQDDKMETLANKGNGNYAYIDKLSEAQKVLVSECGGTLYTIAKDVKLQLEFDPAQVESYRLIGYENRLLDEEDFEDDTKDAGELGAGHTITALYEIVPAAKPSGNVAELRLRYKQPQGHRSKLLTFPVSATAASFGQASINLRWAAAVAEFAMLLRDSEHQANASYDHCEQVAVEAVGRDRFGYRREMVDMIQQAKVITDGTR